MRSRNRSLAALGLSLCIGAAAWALPAPASADPRDGRGWGRSDHDGDHHDRGRHGDRDWDRGDRYGWSHGGYGYHGGYGDSHPHGPPCSGRHAGYAYGYPRPYGWPFWFFGR